MSVCSKHQTKNPTCSTCGVEIEFEEPECDLVTCSNCNFVYYAHCDICPKCYETNISHDK